MVITEAENLLIKVGYAINSNLSVLFAPKAQGPAKADQVNQGRSRLIKVGYAINSSLSAVLSASMGEALQRTKTLQSRINQGARDFHAARHFGTESSIFYALHRVLRAQNPPGK
jgi:hypothetical protein